MISSLPGRRPFRAGPRIRPFRVGLEFAVDPANPSERLSWKPPCALGFTEQAWAAIAEKFQSMNSQCTNRFTLRMPRNPSGPDQPRCSTGPAPSLPSSPSPGQQGFGCRRWSWRGAALTPLASLRKRCAEERASVACVHLLDEFPNHRHHPGLPLGGTSRDGLRWVFKP